MLAAKFFYFGLVTVLLLAESSSSIAIDTQCDRQGDGAPCNDTDPKTINDQCENGVCIGTDVNAQCSGPNLDEGNVCNDGNPQTTDDICHNGVCAGTCPAPLQLIANKCVQACPALATVQNATAYLCPNIVNSWLPLSGSSIFLARTRGFCVVAFLR
jgi:hypothetical protein